jgi:hypothetical protein
METAWFIPNPSDDHLNPLAFQSSQKFSELPIKSPFELAKSLQITILVA